jgi:putative transposase
MQFAYRYKLKPTTEQNATMIEWLNLCRRQYNYRLGERFRWWEATRTSINACPLNVYIVPIERIYQNRKSADAIKKITEALINL